MPANAHMLVDSLSPMMLDNKERTAFDDPEWVFEIKIDGYRVVHSAPHIEDAFGHEFSRSFFAELGR